ncbi:MAG: flagellar biosynthetic protein FliR, partial [Pseudomonadota bacterium]
MPFPMESLEQMQGFFWILVRVSVILFLLPIFGAKGVPVLWKAGVSLMIAIILTPVVPLPRALPETPYGMIMGIASEVMMGLLLSFGVRMLFAAVQ